MTGTSPPENCCDYPSLQKRRCTVKQFADNNYCGKGKVFINTAGKCADIYTTLAATAPTPDCNSS